MGYLTEYMKEVDWYAMMNESETGKMLLKIPQIMDEEYSKIEKNLDNIFIFDAN